MSIVAYNAAVLRPPYSGVEKATAALAAALAARAAFDYRVYVPGDAPLRASLPARLVRPAPRAAGTAPRLRRLLWEQVLLPLRLRAERVALLHAPAYVAPWAAPCRTVVSLHDLHVYTHPGTRPLANRLNYRLLIPPTLRRAAAVLVPSAHTERAVLARFPGLEGRLHRVPLGVDDAFFTPVPPERVRETALRLALPGRYVLFVGDPDPRKGLPVLLQAFGRLRATRPDLSLVLAGAPPLAASECTRHAGPAAGAVCRPGYVAEMDLPAVYAGALALAYPSLDEGFGLPVLEAMACGCPVVCSGGAPLEVAGDAARACDPRDPMGLAAALGEWIDNPAARAEAVSRGRARARLFPWARTAEAAEAVYAAVLREPAQAAGRAARS